MGDAEPISKYFNWTGLTLNGTHHTTMHGPLTKHIEHLRFGPVIFNMWRSSCVRSGKYVEHALCPSLFCFIYEFLF